MSCRKMSTKSCDKSGFVYPWWSPPTCTLSKQSLVWRVCFSMVSRFSSRLSCSMRCNNLWLVLRTRISLRSNKCKLKSTSYRRTSFKAWISWTRCPLISSWFSLILSSSSWIRISLFCSRYSNRKWASLWSDYMYLWQAKSSRSRTKRTWWSSKCRTSGSTWPNSKYDW